VPLIAFAELAEEAPAPVWPAGSGVRHGAKKHRHDDD